MRAKNGTFLLSIVLISISFGLMAFKVNYLNFPLFEQQTTNLWNIEAKISFKARKNEPVLISMALPPKQSGLIIVNEEASSPNYGYTTQQKNDIKTGVWSKRESVGQQTLYYSIDVVQDKYIQEDTANFDQTMQTQEFSKPVLQAANSIVESVYAKSADAITFTSLLIEEFTTAQPSQAVKMIKNHFMKTDKAKRDILFQLIQQKGFQVRTVGALYLEDKAKNIALIPMLEVYYKHRWYLFDVDLGQIYDKSNIFIWQRGSEFLLEAEGAQNSTVRFSVTKLIVPARTIALSKDLKHESALLDFSLFVLPNETQNTFKLLLLVPLGAFVVVFMRVFIGIKTSGTFMPVLLAMAFIETQLLPGILMFLVVVTIGLIVRSYLSYLNLLLVARISSVLIVVVGIMALVAIFAQKLGLEYATSITFFPIIILAWTIERMSITWEEDGAKEVLRQGSGSLIVAICAFFVMTNSTLSFITFNFPEVLVGVLGVIILMGRYSGYRLSELYRFKSMVR